MGGKFLLKQYNNFPKGVEWELFPQFETHIVFQYNTQNKPSFSHSDGR